MSVSTLRERIVSEVSPDPIYYFASRTHREIAKELAELHPDQNGGDDSLFKKYSEYKAMEYLGEKVGEFFLYRKLGDGDVSAVYEAADAALDPVRQGYNRTRYVVKVPSVKHAKVNNMIRHEYEFYVKTQSQVTKLGVGGRAEETLAKVWKSRFLKPVKLFDHGGKQVAAYEYVPRLFTLQQIATQLGPLADVHVIWMFNRIMELLGCMETFERVHNAITPQHLMYTPDNHGLLLVGWIHSEKPGSPIRTVPGTYRSWYESRFKTGTAISLDILMATKCMLYAAEGGTYTIGKKPERMANWLYSFFKGCLYDGQRPGLVARAVYADFQELCEKMLGKKKFHVLQVL